MPSAISIADLQPGDVLLSLGNSKLSDAIRALDGGQYSHAAVWTGTKVVEATLPKVFEHPLSESLKKHPRVYVDAYRHRHVDGKQRHVVEKALQFVGRPYANGELLLAAALIASSTWLPTKQWQLKYLMNLFGFNYLNQANLTPQEGQLVVCTELAVRAYLEAGVPIRVQPTPPDRFRLRAVLDALRELWRERTPRGLVGARIVADIKDGPVDIQQWLAFRQQLRVELIGICLVAPETSRRGLGGSPVFEAGANWLPNRVPPRYLETSPDLKLLGRIHPSVAVAKSKSSVAGSKSATANRGRPTPKRKAPRDSSKPARGKRTK